MLEKRWLVSRVLEYQGRSVCPQKYGSSELILRYDYLVPLPEILPLIFWYRSNNIHFDTGSTSTAIEMKEQPTKPKKIKDVLEAKDFVLDKGPSKKEFKELGNVDQQWHVLRFRQEIAKKYSKSNRYELCLHI